VWAGGYGRAGGRVGGRAGGWGRAGLGRAGEGVRVRAGGCRRAGVGGRVWRPGVKCHPRSSTSFGNRLRLLRPSGRRSERAVGSARSGERILPAAEALTWASVAPGASFAHGASVAPADSVWWLDGAGLWLGGAGLWLDGSVLLLTAVAARTKVTKACPVQGVGAAAARRSRTPHSSSWRKVASIRRSSERFCPRAAAASIERRNWFVLPSDGRSTASARANSAWRCLHSWDGGS
jgi:hypothetical protein